MFKRLKGLKEGWSNGSRWKIMAAGGFLILTVAWVSLVALVVYLHNSEYNPIGAIPLQVVGSPTNPSGSKSLVTIGGQKYLTYVIHFGSRDVDPVLPVTVSRCNSSKRIVTTNVVSQWVEVVPPGEVVPTGNQIVKRVPGCSSQAEAYTVPVGVLTRVLQLSVKGETTSLWQIQGEDTPINPSGGDGTSQSWATQNFAIQYDG